ncbi:uncharacterized protein [Miscanthus floridulus]|uniref:uncharacterized protein n=1 Tax=Miscanthus floridulus TaxID=154761 RepID=UPI00345AA7BA
MGAQLTRSSSAPTIASMLSWKICQVPLLICCSKVLNQVSNMKRMHEPLNSSWGQVTAAVLPGINFIEGDEYHKIYQPMLFLVEKTKLSEGNVAECLQLKISILVIVVPVVFTFKHSLLLLILCNRNGPEVTHC